MWVSLLGCGGPGESRQGVEQLTAVEQASESGFQTKEQGLQANQGDRKPPSVAPSQSSSASSGPPKAVEEQLQQQLIQNPENVQTLFRLATIHSERDDLGAAIELLEQIPVDHSQAGIAALGQAAQWCFEDRQYDKAEHKYKEILERVPNAPPALRQLAFLYNRQGRRHEAAALIQKLCKLGNVLQDELHALVMLTDAIADPLPGNLTKRDRQVAKTVDRRYFPIGPMGRSRVLSTERNYLQAIELIGPLVVSGKAFPAMEAYYLRVLIEAQDEDTFLEFLPSASNEAKEFSEYWAAMGTFLLQEQHLDLAQQAFFRAISKDPTDLLSINRMSQLKRIRLDEEAGKRWDQRMIDVRQTVRDNNQVAASQQGPPVIDNINVLANSLQKLHRDHEALMWRAIAQSKGGGGSMEMKTLRRQRKKLLDSDLGFPTLEQALCNNTLKKLDEQSLMDVMKPLMAKAKERRTTGDAINALIKIEEKRFAISPMPQFVNRAEEWGVHHTYRVAHSPQPNGFAIHQTLGGGVCVLDYDLDGKPDLYFAQGSATPPKTEGNRINSFWRNESRRFVDVTGATSLLDSSYTIGVTAGDWNQDGFDDLLVGNLGEDSLWINNTDGTFRRVAIEPSIQKVPSVTSSLALADLDHDGLPDLLQVNYMETTRIHRFPSRNELGQVIQTISPSNFVPTYNLIGWNQNGEIRYERVGSQHALASMGLGVLVADFDEDNQNEIYFSNDLKANQYWDVDENGTWYESARIRGFAFGFLGSETGAMGIAAADFDQSGSLDMHVTNFQNELNCLYLNQGDHWADRVVQYKLQQSSFDKVGFGTQPIDFDNDGWQDLVISNGHLDESIREEGEFLQLPQFMIHRRSGFELAEVQDPSGYWSKKHLGRSLARLDFNRDGKLDFVVTHLESPVALLENQTPTKNSKGESNRWIAIRLVGIHCERAAIGAHVEVTPNSSHLERSAANVHPPSKGWMVAGDGYLCRNEPEIHLGLGDTDAKTATIKVSWPDGSEQTVSQVPLDHRSLIVQNEPDAYCFGLSTNSNDGP